MGYRSDVAALFYSKKEDFPTLKLFFEENFPYEELGNCVEEFANESYAGFKFLDEDVKWYESYDAVQKFKVFVNRFEILSDDQLWYYEFCRIGEEYQDIELDNGVRSEGLLRLSRVIDFDI